jgi:hypothetical protein
MTADLRDFERPPCLAPRRFKRDRYLTCQSHWRGHWMDMYHNKHRWRRRAVWGWAFAALNLAVILYLAR